MGRNRYAYWESRRVLGALRAKRSYTFTPRDYAFDREAVIGGERGRACLEPIATPSEDAPRASWRVLARWAGFLPTGSVITVGDRRLVALRARPMDGRRGVAHILCRED